MDRTARPYLWVATLAIPLWFLFFKGFYPHASYFPDSYAYLWAAVWRETVSIRPVGYSWWLVLLHGVSHSEFLLVFVQYLLLQVAMLYLFFTVRRYYPFPVRAERWFFVLLVVNPLFLYMANCVSSDALFIALGLAWFAAMIRMIEDPGWGRMGWLLLQLVLLFFVRYTALSCPVVLAVAFFMVRKRGWGFALTGILASVVVVGGCVLLVRELNWRQAGVRTFTAFSSWQIANNALHIYPYIAVDSLDLPGPDCREVDRYVRRYFDTAEERLRLHPLQEATTVYMWNEETPLRRYYRDLQKAEHTTGLRAWSRVGPALSAYGTYLIRQHPFLYLRYYCMPSAHTFFFPLLDDLSRYNEGRSTVDSVAVKWFDYPSDRVAARYPGVQAMMFEPMRWLFLAFNLLFVAATLLFLFARAWRRFLLRVYPAFYRSWILMEVYYIIYAAFSIYAAMTVFRYQLMAFVLLPVMIGRYLSIYRAYRAAKR